MANIDGTLNGTGVFNTQIPDLDDNANIQTALRLYHYGSETPANSGNIEAKSIAGYLDKLTTDIALLTPEETTILAANSDLNDLVESGRYSQNSDTDARAVGSLNYPKFTAAPSESEADGLAYAGLLTVVNTDAENIIYQTYQMASGVNAFFLRTRVSGVWSSWFRVANFNHTHNTLYNTKQEITSALSGKQDSIPTTATASSIIGPTALAPSRVLVTDTSGKAAVSSTVTPTQLELLSTTNTTGTTGKTGTTNLVWSNAPAFNGHPTISSTAPIRANLTNSQIITKEIMLRDTMSIKSTQSNIGIWVTSTTPSGAVAGDLWIW